MSMSSAAAMTKDTVGGSEQKNARRWYYVFYSPLWLCLLAALLLRVWLIVRTQGVIDGDEALVGIQAERILHGVFPTYFYGIPYFGSLEAYLVAILFAIFGPSVWVLRMEPLILSLVLVWLAWRFAGALAEQARLSPSLQNTFMTIAALLAAIPPLYDGVIEMRTWGGWIEIFVLMLLLLLTTLRLTQRWQQGASMRELALRWAGIGLIVGLGMWVYPLITSTIIVAALWILGARTVAEVRRLRGFAPEKPCVSTVKGLLLLVAAIPTAIIGFAPAIFWGAANQWQNITFIVHLGSNGGSISQRFQIIQQVWQLYHTCVAPRIIGGGLPSESALLVKLHKLLVYAGTLGILASVAIVLLSLFWHHALLVRIRQLALLPLLFAACSAIIFCLSSASTSGLMSCNADFAGRYATPLLLTLPFIFASVCIAIIMLITAVGTDLSRPHSPTGEANAVGTDLSRPHSPTGEANAVGTDLSRPHSPTGEANAVGTDLSRPRPPTGEANAVGTDLSRPRPSSDVHNSEMSGTVTTRDADAINRSLPEGFAPLVQGAIFVLVLLYVALQAFTYGLADPGTTFQSPYCSIGPANNDPIIAYMQQQHIHYAWATNFLAYPIVFKTDSQIIAADPLPLIHPKIAINRIPAYTVMVMHADRPSFLVFVRHGDAHPALLSILTAEGVTYRYALFPSEPGVDVLIVTPLNRTVSPISSKAFDMFSCSA
ncbi:MAG TPA: hypothetical protein VNG51_26645 [Ktedonobacteraceae bacterium]|nr:hypothetical protein [Ktedonobacteraceae bacterium]